jgi:hypothetical protein
VGYLSKYSGLLTVQLDENYWVKLRHLRAGELIAITEAGGNSTQAAVKALTLSIVDWNLSDEDDQLLPIGEESVLLLPQEHFTLLMERIAEMTGQRRDPTFRGSAGASGDDRDRGTGDPRPVPLGAGALE